MMSTTKTESLNRADIFKIIFIIALGIGFSIYCVQFPQDKIVERFLTYNKVWAALSQHIYIVAVSSVLAIATSIPLGILLTRERFKKYAPMVLPVVNIGQTIPSLAIVALFVGLLGIGAKTAIFALWIYSLLPILNNTLIGILGLDPSIMQAAHGMGMKPSRILYNVELPMAMPIIVAGIRTAVTINIGTAILAAFVGGGGLGDLIIAGNNINRWQILVLGASLPALMAILADTAFKVVEKRTAI